jgi:hypothetical protein
MAYTNDDKWPGEVHLYIGTLEHPEKFVPTGGHFQTSEQLPWFEIHDELPRFAGLSAQEKPGRHGPKRS